MLVQLLKRLRSLLYQMNTNIFKKKLFNFILEIIRIVNIVTNTELNFKERHKREFVEVNQFGYNNNAYLIRENGGLI